MGRTPCGASISGGPPGLLSVTKIQRLKPALRPQADGAALRLGFDPLPPLHFSVQKSCAETGRGEEALELAHELIPAPLAVRVLIYRQLFRPKATRFNSLMAREDVCLSVLNGLCSCLRFGQGLSSERAVCEILSQDPRCPAVKSSACASGGTGPFLGSQPPD